MAKLTLKRHGGTGDALDAFVPNAQVEGDTPIEPGHGEDGEARLRAQADARRAREKRYIAILMKMAIGKPFLIRK